jgi:hypothetical protein
MRWEEFEEIWLIDFEFLGRTTPLGADKPGNRPVPICLVAHEHLSGRTIRLWEDQFGADPPYRTDERFPYVSAAHYG